MGALNRRRGIIISAVDYGEFSVIQAEVRVLFMKKFKVESLKIGTFI